MYHRHLRRCEDINECLAGSSPDPCGSARCQNSIGGFACTCPTGYEYNGGLRICVQASLGCSRASCAFGCVSLGPSDFRCGCPRGYRGGGGGDHCFAVNDLENFRRYIRNVCISEHGTTNFSSVSSRVGGSYEYLEEGEELSADVVSTEGCFACQLGEASSEAESRRAVGGGRKKKRRRRLHKKHQQRHRHSNVAAGCHVPLSAKSNFLPNALPRGR